MIMNIEEICRADKDKYDYENWFLMNYVKIDELCNYRRTLVK